MGFQARFCIFFLLMITFAILCSARKIPSGEETLLGTEDYDDPGANPRHNPGPPPPMPVSTSVLPRNGLKTQNHLPAAAAKKSGSRIAQKDSAATP